MSLKFMHLGIFYRETAELHSVGKSQAIFSLCNSLFSLSNFA